MCNTYVCFDISYEYHNYWSIRHGSCFLPEFRYEYEWFMKCDACVICVNKFQGLTA